MRWQLAQQMQLGAEQPKLLLALYKGERPAGSGATDGGHQTVGVDVGGVAPVLVPPWLVVPDASAAVCAPRRVSGFMATSAALSRSSSPSPSQGTNDIG